MCVDWYFIFLYIYWLCHYSCPISRPPHSTPSCPPPSHFIFLKKDLINLFLDRGEGREEERERNSVWEGLMRPLLGSWLTTQACALTGNRTGDPLVHRPVLNPLSHTSQGKYHSFPTEALVYVIGQLYKSVILSLIFIGKTGKRMYSFQATFYPTWLTRVLPKDQHTGFFKSMNEIDLWSR